MRILFVNPYYKPYLGGIERVIEKLAAEFQKSGHEVGVLTSFAKFPSGQQNLPAEEIIDGVAIYRRRFRPESIPFVSASPGAGFSGDVSSVLDDFKPDVIQLMSDRWWPVNQLVFQKRGPAKIFYSLSFHDLNLSFPASLAKIPIRRANRFLTNHVDKTIVITKLEAEKIQQTYGTKAEKITVIPWGVDEAGPFKKVPNPKIQILSVGRISRHKGQGQLVRAFAEAKPQFNRPAEIVLAGADEGLWADLATEVKMLGLGHDIRWAGEVTDEKLKEFYQSADIFALTPEYEAFGLVFLEAASYGLPVVTWDVGAIREVLGDRALISPAGEVSAVAADLVRLVNDEKTRQDWSLKSKLLAKKYSWTKTAEQFLEQYQR